MYPYMSKPQNDRSIEVPEPLIKDLLTPSEWRMVKQRFLITHLLSEGLSIRQVAARAGVGTDTVVRVARLMEKTPAVKDHLKKTEQPNSSKWIFGQAKSEE
jgi:uncharacterized protein YerC